MINLNPATSVETRIPTGRRAAGRTLTVAVLALGAAACDLSVTNPGPVQDEFLNDPSAQQSVVSGAEIAMAYALNWVSYTGAYISREAVPSGNAGNLFGAPTLVREGILDQEDNNEHWEYSHKARWVAEDAARRFQAVLDDADSNANVAQVLLIAGYANRLLGENMCSAVIDGSAEQPYTAHLDRADSLFTEAMEIAGRAGNTQIQNAALAGRASVRRFLGDWEGAVADARQVPAGFTHQQTYYNQEWDDYNRFYWGNANLPFRAVSVWSTFYESYFLESGDARVAWGKDDAFPVGESGVTWYFPLKYDEIDSPINLSSWREMQLILAEAAMERGSWQEGVQIVNQLRAESGVAPWAAAGPEEAWEALKAERGIELWLEGRRLGDLRRWQEQGTPGATTDMEGRSLCFPISHTERQTNPNLNG